MSRASCACVRSVSGFGRLAKSVVPCLSILEGSCGVTETCGNWDLSNKRVGRSSVARSCTPTADRRQPSESSDSLPPEVSSQIGNVALFRCHCCHPFEKLPHGMQRFILQNMTPTWRSVSRLTPMRGLCTSVVRTQDVHMPPKDLPRGSVVPGDKVDPQLGDYPAMPFQNQQFRPYSRHWWDTQDRRQYGETVRTLLVPMLRTHTTSSMNKTMC